MSSAPPPVAGVAPRPAALVIVCAVPAERRALAGVEGVRSIVVGGIGPAAAARASREALRASPAALISAGFCGALDGALRVGDLVAATEVIDAVNGERIRVDAELLGAAPGLKAPLASTPRMVLDPVVRAALPGAAVDMESVAIGRAAAEAGVPFLALRAVTDAARHRMPDLQPAIDAEGALRGPAVAAHLASHPRDLPSFVRLGVASRTAARSLRRGVETLAARL